MIDYVVGDATDPQGSGHKIICHVVNNVGAWGAGFVMALSAKWSLPEEQYRWWANNPNAANIVYKPFELGQVQYVEVDKYFIAGSNAKLYSIWVANLIGQNGVRSFKNPRPVDYDAIAKGLADVSNNAMAVGASVHMPRIGCGLAGGEWSKVEFIIERYMDPDLRVTVYDLA